MRTFSKVLAVAALSLASVSSFAATWTGSLAGVKIEYFPDSGGTDQTIAVQLQGTGSTCPSGKMILMNIGPQDTRAFYEAMLHAKATNGSVTIDYTMSSFVCRVNMWTRN